MLKPIIRTMSCVVAVGLMTSCGGSSQPKLSTADKNFLGGIGSYDRDHNDVVTCEEWRATAADLFAQADKSRDGVLVEADYASLARIDRTFLVTPFKHFDANGDGKIEKAEFVDRPNPAFAYADKDKDCKLTKLEVANARNLSGSTRRTQRPKSTNPVTSTPSGTSGY